MSTQQLIFTVIYFAIGVGLSFLAVLIAYGAWSTVRDTRRKIALSDKK